MPKWVTSAHHNVGLCMYPVDDLQKWLGLFLDVAVRCQRQSTAMQSARQTFLSYHGRYGQRCEFGQPIKPPRTIHIVVGESLLWVDVDATWTGSHLLINSAMTLSGTISIRSGDLRCRGSSGNSMRFPENMAPVVSEIYVQTIKYIARFPNAFYIEMEE